MTNRGESIRAMRPLFQAGEGGSIPTSPLQLWLETVDFPVARDLNKLWHSRLPRIGDPVAVMRDGLHYVATFNDTAYAAAIWTHPVNRDLPQDTWLELRRLAIAPDAPKNTASRLLGVMARLVKKSRPELVRLVSYQDMGVHTGTIYRAAGWEATTVKRFSSWTNGTRSRPDDQAKSDKQRWEKSVA